MTVSVEVIETEQGPAVAVCLPLATWILNLNVPEAVGVPPITFPLNPTPAGNAPPTMENA